MRTSQPTRRHGLTLVELIIGTAMLGMIGTALASFALAMSQGWKNSQEKFNTQNASKVAGDTVEMLLTNMLYVAQSQPAVDGSPEAYVFYWDKDGVIGAGDRKAQLGEMALLQYDSNERSLKLYKARPISELTLSQIATLAADSWGDPTSPAIVAYFKSLESVTSQNVVGGSVSGIYVLDATFKCFTPVGGKPMTAYQIGIRNGNTQDASFGSIPIRAGRKPTNFS